MSKPKLQVGAAYLVRWGSHCKEEHRGTIGKVRIIERTWGGMYMVEIVPDPFGKKARFQYLAQVMRRETLEEAIIRRCIWGNPKEELPF